jgi:hypothetical protein
MAEISIPHSSSVMAFTFRVGDSLDIHLCQGGDQRPLTAQTLLEGRRIKTTLPDLRHGKGDFAHAGADRLGLVSIRVALAVFCALVFACLEIPGPFRLHHVVDQNPEKFWNSFQSLLCQIW